jgi:hypothetical protein
VLEPERIKQLETIINDPTTTAEQRAEAYRELGLPDPSIRPVPEQATTAADEDRIVERYLTAFDREWYRSLPEPMRKLCDVFTEIKLGCIDWEDRQLDVLIQLYQRSKSAIVKNEVRNYVRALAVAASLPRWRNAEVRNRAEKFMEQTQ